MKTMKMRDVVFDKSLFENFRSGTILDTLLCCYKGLPKGVNYMIIGDPGVGKTTIILDLISNISYCSPNAKILFISAGCRKPKKIYKQHHGLGVVQQDDILRFAQRDLGH